MKLHFRGWKREVFEHHHSVIPVAHKNNMFTPGETDDPLTCDSALHAFGKVEGLGLSGAFLVQFEFEQDELKDWLRQFVKAKPEAAIRLLSEMQGKAILALAKKQRSA